MESLEKKVKESETEKTSRPSFGDYTRKSVVGAVYRVGASFAMDAVYLSLASAGTYYFTKHQNEIQSIYHGFSDFFKSLDIAKLGRVAGFVVAINFIDYKWDITNRLNNATKKH